jgi:hypothetical protein
VAVVAAIDLNGDVVGLTLQQKCILKADFMEFLSKVSLRCRGKGTVFLDNLPMHKGKLVKEHAK